MELLSLVILVLGSALSFWASSLVARALAERAEIRALRRRAAAPGGPAPPPDVPEVHVNPLRNKLVFCLAPIVFALGLFICWVALGISRMSDVLPWVTAIGVPAVLVAIGQVQIAAALGCVGWWYDPARGRRRCPMCWYDMASTQSRHCSECGHETATESAMFRTRRKAGMIKLAVVIGLATYIGVKIPPVLQYGPFSFVPTTLLIGTYEYWPEELIRVDLTSTLGTNKASLGNRIARAETFQWQAAWLKSRRKQLAENSLDPAIIHRSIFLFETPYGERFAGTTKFSPRTLRTLFEMMASTDAEDRRIAAELLWRAREATGYQPPNVDPLDYWDEPARAIAPRLVPILRDPNTSVAEIAALIVARGGVCTGLPIQEMLADVKQDSTSRRDTAVARVRALRSLSATCDQAAQAVLELSQSPDAVLRRFSTWGLSVGTDTRPEYRARLYEMLGDPNGNVALSAAATVVRFDHSDEFISMLLHQVETRTDIPSDMCDIVETAYQSQVQAGGPHQPAWLSSRLLVIMKDPSRPPMLRGKIAAWLGLWDDTPGLLDALRNLAAENALGQWEQETLLSRIKSLEELEVPEAATNEAEQQPSAAKQPQ